MSNIALLVTALLVSDFTGHHPQDWILRRAEVNQAVASLRDYRVTMTQEPTAPDWLRELAGERVADWIIPPRITEIHFKIPKRRDRLANRRSRYPDDAAMALVSRLWGVHRLRIDAAGRITDRGLKQLLQLHELKDLSLGYANLTADAVQTLSILTRLESLRVSGAAWPTDVDLRPWVALENLEELDVSDTSLDDRDLAQLEGLPSLKKLDASYTDVTFEGADCFEAARPSCDLELEFRSRSVPIISAESIRRQLRQLERRPTWNEPLAPLGEPR